jgi:hypothetical protein
MVRHRFAVWDKEDGFGTECGDVALERDRLAARGLAIRWTPARYSLEYDLETGSDWVTTRLQVESRGEGWRRSLDLRRSPSGTWSIESRAEGSVDLPPPGGDVTTITASTRATP